MIASCAAAVPVSSTIAPVSSWVIAAAGAHCCARIAAAAAVNASVFSI